MNRAGDEPVRYVLSPAALTAPVDGDLAILDSRSGLYFGLNKMGALIWERLRNGATVEEVVAALAPRFAVDTERLRDDVSKLIEELFNRGLVKHQGEEVTE